MRGQHALWLAAALGAMAAPAPAAAQFEIEKSTTASQQVTMELYNTVRVGDVSFGDAQTEHKIGVDYGAFTIWSVGLGVSFANDRGETVDFRSFDIESRWAILGGETGDAGGFSLAFFSGVEIAQDDDDSELTLGPAFGYDAGALSVLGNTFAVIPLGGGDNDTGFEYAGQVFYDVGSNVALGVQAYGEVPNVLSDTPAAKRQEHFAGPAVSFSFEPEPGREVDVNLGAFIGLTDAAPTAAASINLELGF